MKIIHAMEWNEVQGKIITATYTIFFKERKDNKLVAVVRTRDGDRVLKKNWSASMKSNISVNMQYFKEKYGLR